MTPNEPRGEVVTFYSYKGGVGRSMALANVGCLLARRPGSRGVLLVDWDLEAPGLHRYFAGRLTRAERRLRSVDDVPGLIDLFREIDAAAALERDAAKLETIRSILARIDFGRYIVETDIPSLFLLKAGAFGADYAQRVNTFDWEGLFHRCPMLFPLFAEHLARRFDWVLVDSRTGETDTSGISTMLLPERLVLVFTPNEQSLAGAVRFARRAVDYRSNSTDLRPFRLFPLPSRIEPSEPKLRTRWRFDPEFGYQPRFEHAFRELYRLERCDLSDYFDDVQIQHSSSHAYGERIAVLEEERADRLSMARSFETFADWLTSAELPWTRREAEALGAAEAAGRAAEAAFVRLDPDDQLRLEQVLPRLVRLAGPEETGGDSGQRVPVEELDPASLASLRALADARVLEFETVDGRETVRFANDVVPQGWTRLAGWIARDREYLFWRQQLRGTAETWLRSGADRGALLSGALLDGALERARGREHELTPFERGYLEASLSAAMQQRRARVGMALAVTLLVVGLGLAGWVTRSQRIEVETALAEATSLEATGELDAARASYRKVVALDPGNGLVWRRLALLSLREGDSSAALDALGKAIEAGDVDARGLRGELYLELEDNGSALADLDAAIAATPHDARLLTLRAHAYEGLGQPERALADYARALELEPRFAQTLFDRAVLLQRLGRRDAAVAGFEEVLGVDADPLLQEAARARLAELRPALLHDPAFANERMATVFVHYADPRDERVAREVRSAVERGNVRAGGVELQPRAYTNGDVRYFYAADREEAQRVLSRAEAALAKLGHPLRLKLIDAGASARASGRSKARVAEGTIELWLPSLVRSRGISVLQE